MNKDEGGRTRRVSEQLQRELAQIIQREVKDPRIGWVTVSAVKVTRDLTLATVYITVLNSEDQGHREIEILTKATGFLRHEIGRRMRLRIVPHLKFVYDDSLDRGNRMAKLINDALSAHPVSGTENEENEAQ